MKRPELKDKEKIQFLSKILARLFGYSGSVKLDWRQEMFGEYHQLTLKNVDLSYDNIRLLEPLSAMFDLQLDNRAYIGEEVLDSDDGKIRLIHTDQDLVITENYETHLLRLSPKKFKKERSHYEIEWTKEDEEKYDHNTVE